MVDASSRRLFARSARRGTAAAMYRLVIPVLLFVGAVVGAPQDSNKSEETYVKIEPINETTLRNLASDSSETVKEVENDSQVGSDDVTTESDQSSREATTETAELLTDADERKDQAVLPAEEVKTRTKTPSPRFYSKLSYFQKPDFVSGSPLTNLVERNNKRKFKSRCRCEKIWNCPKLQITVPRCPDEYFMCCF